MASEKPAAAKPISEVALTAFRLRQIEDSGWTAEEGWTGIVTPAARPLLATFTRQLRELIGRELNGEAGSGTTEEIQAELVKALTREGVPMELDESDHPYGRVLELEVRRSPGLDRWLGVVVTQQIICGFDKALYVFERQEGRWRLAFALEANPDEGIYAGMGLLEFGISQPDRQGGSFIAVADVNPQCVSNWRRIRYRVFRLGGESLQPQPFFAGEGSVFRCDFALSVKGDRFLVTFEGYQNLDAGILIRSYMRAYRVAGTKVERTGPLAAEERGFIDEWISLPWAVAGRWAGIPNWESLRAWHFKLQGMLQREGEHVYTEIREWGDCGPSRFQAVLDLDWDQPSASRPSALFFTVRRQGDDFEMERIGITEQEGCTSESDRQVP